MSAVDLNALITSIIQPGLREQSLETLRFYLYFVSIQFTLKRDIFLHSGLNPT